jgi:hypothetical protein
MALPPGAIGSAVRKEKLACWASSVKSAFPIFSNIRLAFHDSDTFHSLRPIFGLEYVRHGRPLLAQNGTIRVFLRRSAKGQENRVGRSREPGSTPEPRPDEARRAPDHLPHRRRKERRRNCHGNLREQLKSEGSQSGTSSREALAQTRDVSGNQGKQAFRRFTSSSAGKALRSSLNCRAIRLSDIVLRVSKSSPSPRSPKKFT